MSKPTTLSATARAVLTAGAQRADRRALAPERLPVAAQRAVVQSLLKAALIREVPADGQAPWRTSEDGTLSALQVTDVGLRAVGVEPASTMAEDACTGANTRPLMADTPTEAADSLCPPIAAQETATVAEPTSGAADDAPTAANMVPLSADPASGALNSLPLPVTAQDDVYGSKAGQWAPGTPLRRSGRARCLG